MTKPALLLDVDGVLCPFGEVEGHQQLWIGADDAPHFLSDLWVWYDPQHKDRLRRLKEHFELIWATGWEHQANIHLLEAHGLEDPLPVITFTDLPSTRGEDHRFHNGHWKMPWIIKWAEETQRPFIWIDDDLRPEALEWADNREIPAYFIKTDCQIGMTDGMVEEMIEWAKGLESGT